MNSGIKIAIGFIAGLATGGAIGWFVHKRITENATGEMIKEIREYYISREKSLEKRFTEREEPKQEFEAPKSYVAPIPEGIGDTPVHSEFINYNKVMSRYTREKPSLDELVKMLEKSQEAPDDYEIDGDDEDDVERDPNEDMHPEDVDHKFSLDDVKPIEVPDHDPEPYVITSEEYMINDGIQHKEALWWHVHDRILIDENDDIVDNELVGDDILDLLYEEDVIYVRNVEIGLDWEIIKTEASAAEYMEDKGFKLEDKL